MSDPNLTIPGPGEQSPKRRATVGEMRKLEEQVRNLTASLSRVEMLVAAVKPDNPELPMSRDYFMALCIIGTLQSGGWQQLKYLKARASQAYDAWTECCEPVMPPEPKPEPELAGLV